MITEAKDHRYHIETQVIEKYLLKDSNPLLQDIIAVKEQLEQESLFGRNNKRKAEEMHRKILMLEVAESRSKSIANSYRKKLQKLQNSQEMMINMYHLKAQEIEKREREQEQRKRKCIEMKDSLLERKHRSFDVLERRKNVWVKQIRQINASVILESHRRSEEDFQSRKQRKQQIQSELSSARSRLQHYEQFKVAQSQYNYNIKKQEELKKYIKNVRHLKQLKSKVKQENELFRRTQVLEKEANQIQSFYLTNQEPDEV